MTQADVERNKQRVRAVFEQGFGLGRLEVVDEAVSAQGVDRHPFGPDEPDMREHLKNAIRMFRSAMPDLSVSVEHLVAEGDLVAARVLMRGTHTGGPLLGTPAGGRAVQVEQFHLVQIDPNGRGARHWGNVGEQELRAQLGAAPAAV